MTLSRRDRATASLSRAVRHHCPFFPIYQAEAGTLFSTVHSIRANRQLTSGSDSVLRNFGAPLMPIGRYFLFVGGALLSLLFLADQYLPKPALSRERADIDKSTIRIHSIKRQP